MGEFLRAEEVYGDLSPTGRKAVDYVRAGLAVIPLKPGDKVPATNNGVNNWTTDTDAVADYWYRNPSANVGIVCGQPSHNLVVIDVDRHGDVDGMGSIAEWATSNGMELPETVTFETGSGGRHYLYRTAQEVRGSINGELAVDVKGKGGYIVAPPSLHPNGEYYDEVVGIDDVPIAEADAAVYSLIEHVRPTPFTGAGERAHFELPETIPNGRRNDTLYRYACSLRARRMDQVEVLALLREQNGRCVEPLPDSDLAKIADSACTKPAGPSAEVLEFKKRVGLDPTTPVDGGTENRLLVLGKNPRVGEVIGALRSDPVIMSSLRFCTDENRPYVCRPFLPGGGIEDPHPLSDHEASLFYAWFEERHGAVASDTFTKALDAYMAYADVQFSSVDRLLGCLPKIRSVDGGPVRSDPAQSLEYSYDGVEWDPVPLECTRGWLFNYYLGTDMSEYNVEAELLFSRGLAARMLRPGCVFDVMLVLTGAQGVGKSSILHSIAQFDNLFLDGFNRFDEQGVRRLSGRLLVEVSELSGFKKTDMNVIKDVLTRRVDTIHRPYARYDEDVRRRAVFVGTTNDSYFLSDTTGNRRFMPVECHRKREEKGHPDIKSGKQLENCRIWLAQAVQEALDMGVDEFLKTLSLPDSVGDSAIEAQERHTMADDVMDAVESYLAGLGGDTTRVNVRMVMAEGLGYDKMAFSKESRYVKSNVAGCIERAGWVPAGKQRCGKYGIARSWQRPELLPTATT